MVASSESINDKPKAAADVPAADRTDVFAEIAALTQSCTSAYGFLTKSFRAISRWYDSPFALLSVRFASQEVRDDFHSGPTDPGFWKASLEGFLIDSLNESAPRARLLRAKNGKARVGFVSAPVFDPSGARIGAMAMVLHGVDDQSVPLRLAELGALSRVVSISADRVEQRQRNGGGENPPGTNQALARAAKSSSMEELAFGITNALRNRIGGEQVVLGIVSGKRVRIVSISGLDEVRHQSPGVRSIQGAMEECLDLGEPIVCQREGDGAEDGLKSGHRLHRQWHGDAKGASVASMPLRMDGETVAVLSLRRGAARPFTRGGIAEIQQQVEAYAPALLLTRRANRSVWRHAVDSVREAVGKLTSPGPHGSRITVIVTALFIGWFVFGTWEYQITVPCTVTPAKIRHAAAPFDGVLASAERIAGDHVRQGDVLCTFDRRDLELQRSELEAEIAVLEREKDRTFAREERAEYQVAEANQRLARAKLAVAERRIEQSVLRAPIDGMVVVGDLRKRIGSVVEMGTPLFEVAPLEDWKLEVEVPEWAAEEVRAGLEGAFAFQARPESTQPFTIERMRPQAEVRDERNVFVAEARVKRPSEWMRPGMEGMARVHVGRRRVWWVALHRVIDYLQLNMWL